MRKKVRECIKADLAVAVHLQKLMFKNKIKFCKRIENSPSKRFPLHVSNKFCSEIFATTRRIFLAQKPMRSYALSRLFSGLDLTLGYSMCEIFLPLMLPF